jgi:5'-nucleotidase / UDP-sugar diphosphatase
MLRDLCTKGRCPGERIPTLVFLYACPRQPSKYIVALVRFSKLIATTLLFVALALAGATQTHVIIMHTNDIHGHVLPENNAGGLAIIAAIVKQQRPDILLDAGDMFAGTVLSDTYYGESIMAVMNRMGYHASILGNHEFDYGLKMLRNRVRQARFPVLSANVILPFDDVRKTRVIQAKGIRFGVVGLTTDETPVTTHPKNMKSVQVLDVVRALEQNLPQLRKTSDFVIALGHLAPEEERRVARAFPEIKLIISGHSHTELQQPIRENGATIVRTGSFGRFVGRVDLDFEDRALKKMSERLIEVKGVAPDPDALKVVEPYRAKLERQMNAVLGEATAPLARLVEEGGAVLNLVTDAYRAKTGTQIALTNTGGVRTSLPVGPITYGKVFEILPFESTLVTMKITGAQLKRSLAVGITAVSGARAVFDLSKPKNERLVSATLEDGSPIVDDAIYSITINDFMQAGGDDYTEFASGTEAKDLGLRLRDVVIEYIKAKKTVTPVIDGRLQIINGPPPRPAKPAGQ